ncbi:helix-turn-helix domain-containing protein [Pseudoduganella sp. FT26W]|uniref:Helix-turn-helix domain-containing protein n=1 Tax=Duganella aquatilis TaxID=2666082 RepID=A0A844D460_9BURK|nr:helix-turn-helix domain-containing protein [Duganella aquatilis]MRW87877.1 helix-turn-helix domain-containing protein [Duganella aquatilis]
MNAAAAYRHRIAVIAFDGITPFHLSVPGMVFRDAAFDLKICSADPSPLRTTGGFDISVRHGLQALGRADIVILPTWHDDCRPAPAALLEALKRAHRRGARIVGLCLGAFPLAEAGLLDGRRATTHWAYADTLAARHPDVAVDREVLYVDDEVLTSAGVAAGLDCCLHLLRQLCGAEAANHVARQLVVAPHRQGGQAQFIERPVPVSGSDDRFAQVLDWVNQRLADNHSIDALAARAAMSRRNFTRHFRDATGTSFKQWLLNQRVAHAQRLLETSDVSIELVAQEAGFGSALSLRQHFRTALCTSPSEYRRQFRAGAG